MHKFGRNESGSVKASAAIALLSIVLGGGAAIAATAAVVSSFGPKDSQAIKTGPQTALDPNQVITYGG